MCIKKKNGFKGKPKQGTLQNQGVWTDLLSLIKTYS